MKLLSCVAALSLAATPAFADAPKLVKQGTATQLQVQGKPMLLLAGELGNSSDTSEAYMAPHWKRLRAMHLNTVLAPVSWELIEPKEGQYDWSSVDTLIRNARANNLHLVFLWFGAWKNSMSTYVPAWVKRDQARFPRAQLPSGQGVDILSSMAPATLAADQKIFAALLAHIKAVDAQQNTVLMVQVENEIGMLPVARDYGPQADAAYRGQVPAELMSYLQQHHDTGPRHASALGGQWRQNQRHMGRGVRAGHGLGRNFHRLALCALCRWADPRWQGRLRSADVCQCGAEPARSRARRISQRGPLPHLIDVWKAGAPALDFLAPDIYFTNFVDIVNTYKRPDNPLFIPEANNADHPQVPGNAFYAIGKLDAIGFGPFSIESVDEKPGALAGAYDVLEQISPQILAAQGLGRMSGFRPRALYDGTLIYEPVTERIGDYRFTVSFADIVKPEATPETGKAGAVIVQTGPEDYIVAGQGVTVTFEPVGPGPRLAGIDSAWEGHFDAQNRWIAGRLLNGDQTHQGRHIQLAPGEFQIQRIKLYRYQ
jgi:beta-galactosidase GanA